MEVKCYEGLSNFNDVSTTLQLTCINAIAGGYQWYERIGSKVRNLELCIRGSIVSKAAHTSVNTQRTFVLLDTQANGTTPAVTDIFPATTGYGLIHCPVLWTAKERFAILADEVTSKCAAYGGAGVGNPETTTIEWRIPLDFDTYYSASAGAIASIRTNSLWIGAISVSAVGVNPFDGGFYSRLTYTDG